MSRTAPESRICATVLAAVVGLAVALPATAQWRWRDASGRITASDLPPPREVADKDILQRPGAQSRAQPAAAAPASAPSAPMSVPVDKNLETRRRTAELHAKEKAKAEEQRIAAVRAENCSRARAHLNTLDSGQRMARINDKGEREVLDDAARAAEARRAREVIASDCR